MKNKINIKANIKMILVITMLVFSIIIIMTSNQVFFPDEASSSSQNTDNKTDGTKVPYESKQEVDDSNITFFEKIKNKALGTEEPTITIENSEINVINTELDQYNDAKLIEEFGVVAEDGDGNPLDISVSKTKKSDILTKVTFTAKSDSGYVVSIDGMMNVVYNAKPKVTVQNRKVTLSGRKYKRYSEEKMQEYITKKAGVKATDKEDGKLEIEYDLSAVNPDEKGDYKVKLKATDNDKQSTSAEVVVSIK